ncbi:MAG: 5'-nucleotidase [Promethearchaeota archaeon CR_4]|nr:MAG: 5'-nucleotidase [Candidatus Lokiarchaeota archaeon CR_4]
MGKKQKGILISAIFFVVVFFLLITNLAIDERRGFRETYKTNKTQLDENPLMSEKLVWNPNGTAICTGSSEVEEPQLIVDGSGGAIIVWQDQRNGDWDIYAQRIDATGAVYWIDNGTVICTAENSQSRPQLVSDGNGGAIITWHDNRYGNWDIFAQRVNSEGITIWPENGTLISNATAAQQNPLLESDGNGGAIIVWGDQRNGDQDIYAQRVDAAGTIQWIPNGTAICDATGGQYNYQLTSDGVGGAIVTWQDSRNGASGYDIYAQRVDTAGTIQWVVDGTAICTEYESQWSPQLASDGTGGAFIVWQDDRSMDYGDIYAQRVDFGGNNLWIANGTAICTANDEQYLSQLVNDGANGAIITWFDRRNGIDNDIYSQRISSMGQIQWVANGTAICTEVESQRNPRLVSDGDGGAIITWIDHRNGEDEDIYAQWVNSTGNLKWIANGTAICTAGYDQSSPQLVNDESGGVIITWEDYRTSTSEKLGEVGQYSDIYAQRVVVFDPPTNLVLCINDGAAETAIPAVTLTLSASNATEMRFSNDGITYSAWEAYNTTKIWTLESGAGVKTVYFKARNRYYESGPVTDTIIPSTGVIIPGFPTLILLIFTCVATVFIARQVHRISLK